MVFVFMYSLEETTLLEHRYVSTGRLSVQQKLQVAERRIAHRWKEHKK
jgi:hypothetical protein